MNRATQKKALTWVSVGASDRIQFINQISPGLTARAFAYMKFFKLILVTYLLCWAGPGLPEQVYHTKDSFLAMAFPGGQPNTGVVWLTSQRKLDAEELLGHSPSELRIRYWSLNGRSAWILDKIGKEQPITIGVIVEDAKVEGVEILVYRESRGGEVRHDFFKKQFEGAQLIDNIDLDRNIDGISGATLSVNAVTNVTKWALYLHKQILE